MGYSLVVGAMIGALFGLLRAERGKPGPAWTVPAGMLGGAGGAAGWNALLGIPLLAATSPSFFGGILLSVLAVVSVQAMKADPL